MIGRCIDCLHWDEELFREMEIGFCNINSELTNEDKIKMAENDRFTERDCTGFFDKGRWPKSIVKRVRVMREKTNSSGV